MLWPAAWGTGRGWLSTMCSDRGASFEAVTLVSEDIPDQGLEEEDGKRVQVGSACSPQRAYESPPSRG